MSRSSSSCSIILIFNIPEKFSKVVRDGTLSDLPGGYRSVHDRKELLQRKTAKNSQRFLLYEKRSLFKEPLADNVPQGGPSASDAVPAEHRLHRMPESRFCGILFAAGVNIRP